MTDAGVSWTDERVELLKKLWSDGLSASQIATELGNVTRNAVIGKVHRLGLSGRAKDKAAARPASAQDRPRSERTGADPAAEPHNNVDHGAGSTRPPVSSSGADALRPTTTWRFPCRSA